MESKLKEPCKAIIDMKMFNKIDNSKVRDILIKNKVITRSTKYIYAYCTKLGDSFAITVKNGAGRIVISEIVKKEEVINLT